MIENDWESNAKSRKYSLLISCHSKEVFPACFSLSPVLWQQAILTIVSVCAVTVEKTFASQDCFACFCFFF